MVTNTSDSTSENTSTTPLAVNLTNAASFSGGAAAYAAFCSAVAAAECGARVVSTPKWLERLPSPLRSVARYAFSRLLLGRYPGVIYNPTYRTVPGHPRQIVTVLDLIPLHHPSQHRLQYRYFSRILPASLRRALGVIVLSETMGDEIRWRFGLTYARVRVVPPGVDTQRFCVSETQQPISTEPYLLAVGASLPHKNIHELLQYHELWARDYRLIVTGASASYGRRLREHAHALGIGSRVEVRSWVSENDIVELYRGCSALVYPSLDEGFGLPPLEALACGRPVIVSDIAVHREVCGDAAFYVQPGNRLSWVAALEGIADPGRSEQRVARGAERVRIYSWENTRRRLVEAMEAFGVEMMKGTTD